MIDKRQPDEKYLDHLEEYWIKQDADKETEVYFPLEETKPPHY